MIENKTKEDLIGPILSVLLLVGTSFHFYTKDIFLYYREAISLLYLFFVAFHIYKEVVKKGLVKLKIYNVVLYLCIFPIILILISFGDQKVKLYEINIEASSNLINNSETSIYIIRNAVLYIPMVLYFYIYGISEKAIKCISLIILLIAPLSIDKLIESLNLDFDVDVTVLLLSGPAILPYNSYIPSLTFSVLACFYFIFSKSNIFFKIFILVVLSYLLFIIVVSSSRQSIMFCMISFLTFFFWASKNHWKYHLYLALFLLLIYYSLASSLNEFVINEELISRFTTTDGMVDSNRVEKIKDGIMMLNLFELFTGAGLSSVNGGPHNDYIQWLQRIGLLPMIVSFLPYLISFKSAVRLVRKNVEFNSLHVYIMLSIFFTLFHSFFGHPREDAFQAPLCFLGLALWLGTFKRAIRIHT